MGSILHVLLCPCTSDYAGPLTYVLDMSISECHLLYFVPGGALYLKSNASSPLTEPYMAGPSFLPSFLLPVFIPSFLSSLLPMRC